MAKFVGPEPGCGADVIAWLVVPYVGLEVTGEVAGLAGCDFGRSPVVVVWLNVSRVRTGGVGNAIRLGAHGES